LRRQPLILTPVLYLLVLLLAIQMVGHPHRLPSECAAVLHRHRPARGEEHGHLPQ
jgi:hypothetical protein